MLTAFGPGRPILSFAGVIEFQTDCRVRFHDFAHSCVWLHCSDSVPVVRRIIPVRQRARRERNCAPEVPIRPRHRLVEFAGLARPRYLALAQVAPRAVPAGQSTHLRSGTRIRRNCSAAPGSTSCTSCPCERPLVLPVSRDTSVGPVRTHTDDPAPSRDSCHTALAGPARARRSPDRPVDSGRTATRR